MKPTSESYYALFGVKIMAKVRQTGLNNPFSYSFYSKSRDDLPGKLKRNKPHDRTDQQVNDALSARRLQ